MCTLCHVYLLRVYRCNERSIKVLVCQWWKVTNHCTAFYIQILLDTAAPYNSRPGLRIITFESFQCQKQSGGRCQHIHGYITNESC